MDGPTGSGKGEGARGLAASRLRDFLFGMTGYEFAREALETRAALETIFLVVTVGDMVGDIAAGLAAEIVAFGVRGGMASDVQLRDAGAEAVLDDVNDLLKVLNCWSPFPSLKLDSPRLPPARGGPSSGAAV